MEFLDGKSFQELLKKWPGVAIQHLKKYYYHKLVHIAERKIHNREAAEDIVQEAFIEIWKKSQWLAGQNGILIGPYLIGIVKYKAITHYNQSLKKEVPHSSDVLDAIVSTRPTIELEIILADNYQRVHDLVSALPERERTCIELKYFKEMSNDSIARELGISKKTVEKHLTSALKLLRKQRPWLATVLINR